MKRYKKEENHWHCEYHNFFSPDFELGPLSADGIKAPGEHMD